MVSPKVVGVGFTLMVTVKGVPIQAPDIGVMVYSILATSFVVLVNV